ncbi:MULTISPECIES: TlpA disulfide reductase family protein [Nocardia]|uniref:TlpA disulfide reductase family protein n=1 Tax=Nocardia TaxID=1817 RepID=UPI0005938289|nr:MULTISPECIES: TlpA disulfide reductase family protein [Nocardia]
MLATAVAISATLLSGCSLLDPPRSSSTFDFVSPGGKTDIFYDPPETRGEIAPLAGPDLMTDQPISSADHSGKVVVINIWGQWCGPCRAEADDLERAYAATKDSGVEFLGINVRDPQRDKARDFVTDYKIGYPSIYDPSMRTLLALGGNFPTSVIPATLILDRRHRVAAVYLRSLRTEDLQPAVERIAAEP